MAKPINWKSNLFFVWVAEICSRAGFSVAIPFIPFFMRDRYLLTEGAVKNGVMLFGLAGSVALFFSFPLWGMVGDRLGRRLMLLRAMFCSGILYASFMFAPTLGILIALRFITGFFSGTVSPAQALVATTTPEDKHGFALGALSSSVWSGNMLGLLLGGLVVKFGSYNAFWQRICGFAPDGMIAKNWSYYLAFALTMVLFFFAGMIVLFFVRENFVPPPAPAPAADGAPRRKEFALAGFGGAVYAILGMLLWISFARRCDENYISLMVEVVSNLKGKEAAHIVGTIGFAAAVGNVLGAIAIGFFSDRMPLRRLILPLALVGAAALTGQALSTTPLMLGCFRLLTFLMAGGLEPAALGLLSRESPKAKKGTIFGCVASLRIFGLMLGTFLGWAVMKICDRLPWDRFPGADPHALGIRGIFLLGALAMLLLIPWVFFVERMVAKHHREAENRTA